MDRSGRTRQTSPAPSSPSLSKKQRKRAAPATRGQADTAEKIKRGRCTGKPYASASEIVTAAVDPAVTTTADAAGAVVSARQTKRSGWYEKSRSAREQRPRKDASETLVNATPPVSPSSSVQASWESDTDGEKSAFHAGCWCTAKDLTTSRQERVEHILDRKHRVAYDRFK